MTQVRWLKTSFVAGAVADAVFGIVILLPSRMGETEFTYPMPSLPTYVRHGARKELE